MTMTATRVARSAAALVLTSALVAGFAGCSSDKSQACKDSTNLKSSVQDLRDVNVVQDGPSALTSAFNQVQTDFQALQSTAKDEFGPDVTAVSNALSALQAAVQGVASGGVQAVVTAAQQVGTTADKLVSEVNAQKC
jgi:hypothetical protein